MVSTSHVLGTVTKIRHESWTDMVKLCLVDQTKAKLTMLVRTTSINSTRNIKYHRVLKSTVNFCDTRVARYAHPTWLELVLKCCKTQGTVLAFTP